MSPHPSLRNPPHSLFELQQLVRSYGEQPGRWRPLLRYPAPGEDRWWTRLESPEGVDVWLLSWQPGHTTEFHDHGDSGAAFMVVEGELTELRPLPSGELSRQVHAAGDTAVPIDQIHDVIAERVAAVSIHAYSPPLQRMTYFTEQAGGELTPRETVISSDPEHGPRHEAPATNEPQRAAAA